MVGSWWLGQQVEAGAVAPVDQVHVWSARLDMPAPDLCWLAEALSVDEQTRARRFHFRRDGDRFLAARGLLRHILACYLPRGPAELAFTANEYGKPNLAEGCAATGLCFNLAHADDMAVYAVTQKRAVGIDLERLRPLPDLEELAERFFSPGEVARLRGLRAEERVQGFFNCWTRKEAYVKALGQGLSVPLDQFEVSLVPGEPARLLHALAGQHEGNWSMQELVLEGGYVGAVVAEGRGCEIVCATDVLDFLRRRSQRG